MKISYRSTISHLTIFSRGWIAILITAIASLGVIVSFAGTGESSPVSCAHPTPQCGYRLAILKDRSALSAGIVAVQSQVSVTMGQLVMISASVCGLNRPSCGDYKTTDILHEAPTRYQSRLLTGARIQASLEGDIPGGLQRVGPEIEPVLSGNDMATWIWFAQPSQAGNFDLFLTLTPLEGGTDTALIASAPFHINVTVTMTLSQRIISALKAIRDFLLSLSGFLSALGITLVTVVLWVTRRASKIRKRHSPPTVKKSAELADGDTTNNDNLPPVEGADGGHAEIVPR
jgi:hypothetical protein